MSSLVSRYSVLVSGGGGIIMIAFVASPGSRSLIDSGWLLVSVSEMKGGSFGASHEPT